MNGSRRSNKSNLFRDQRTGTQIGLIGEMSGQTSNSSSAKCNLNTGEGSQNGFSVAIKT